VSPAKSKGNPSIGAERIANNINISIPGLDTEYAAVVLDTAGFAVSTKSACSGAGGGASAVVLETTGDLARASATLRITLGPDSTLEQLKSLTEVLKKHVEQMSGY
jgi:cysteine desulfurase